MLQTITKHLKRFKHAKRGLSNVIVVMLSLVILVVISANVILWSYQMNQLDLEREQESVDVLLATRFSPGYLAQKEYTVDKEGGERLEGYYVYTQIDDGAAEQFVEKYADPPRRYRLGIYDDFILDLSGFPLTYVKSVQIQLKYSTNSTEDHWHLNAWNWTLADWSDLGSSKPTSTWTWVYFNVTTDDVANLVNATDGRVRIKVIDRNIIDTSPTLLNIDLLAMRAILKGSCFKFRNSGFLTAHLVALWVIDSEDNHTRYELNLFINPGETITYWTDITWPSGSYLIKVVTERGNSGIYEQIN